MKIMKPEVAEVGLQEVKKNESSGNNESSGSGSNGDRGSDLDVMCGDDIGMATIKHLHIH